jgi:hypothetical protein
MSDRIDQFAMAALTGLLANGLNRLSAPQEAYKIAQAMEEARREHVPSLEGFSEKWSPDKAQEIRKDIPRKEEVLGQVGAVPYPLTAQCAEAYYLDRDAGGWVTKHGHPILNWRSDLQKFARHWQYNGGDKDLSKDGTPKRERCF